jgi:hypothetical protein
MRKRIIFIVGCIVSSMLVSCSTPSPRARLVSSTPRTVVLSGVGYKNTAQALRSADVLCRRYGRYAIHRPDNERDGLATYECVE